MKSVATIVAVLLAFIICINAQYDQNFLLVEYYNSSKCSNPVGAAVFMLGRCVYIEQLGYSFSFGQATDTAVFRQQCTGSTTCNGECTVEAYNLGCNTNEQAKFTITNTLPSYVATSQTYTLYAGLFCNSPAAVNIMIGGLSSCTQQQCLTTSSSSNETNCGYPSWYPAPTPSPTPTPTPSSSSSSSSSGSTSISSSTKGASTMFSSTSSGSSSSQSSTSSKPSPSSSSSSSSQSSSSSSQSSSSSSPSQSSSTSSSGPQFAWLSVETYTNRLCLQRTFTEAVVLPFNKCIFQGDSYVRLSNSPLGPYFYSCRDSNCKDCTEVDGGAGNGQCIDNEDSTYTKLEYYQSFPSYSGASLGVVYNGLTCTPNINNVMTVLVEAGCTAPNATCEAAKDAMPFSRNVFCTAPSFLYDTPSSTATTGGGGSSGQSTSTSSTPVPVTYTTTVTATLTMQGDPTLINTTVILSLRTAFAASLGVATNKVAITVVTNTTATKTKREVEAVQEFALKVDVAYENSGNNAADITALENRVQASASSSAVSTVMTTQNLQVTEIKVASSTAQNRPSSSNTVTGGKTSSASWVIPSLTLVVASFLLML